MMSAFDPLRTYLGLNPLSPINTSFIADFGAMQRVWGSTQYDANWSLPSHFPNQTLSA